MRWDIAVQSAPKKECIATKVCFLRLEGEQCVGTLQFKVHQKKNVLLQKCASCGWKGSNALGHCSSKCTKKRMYCYKSVLPAVGRGAMRWDIAVQSAPKKECIATKVCFLRLEGEQCVG